ncbi:MAG: ferrochelatase [Nitrospirae bacterium]|nr:MAG: ferrochelatase [Nitrospirota bacterium]
MGDKTAKETIGVLLLNLGGPDSLQAVKPFLYNLFSDRQIIKLGPEFLQKPIAWFISTTRHKKTEGFYSLIGGKSPILDITNAQAKALEEALNQLKADSYQLSAFKVFVAMRYWHPLIEEVVPEIHNAGIRKLIVLSLYPQYSLATTGSSLSKFKEVASKYKMEASCIESWFNHPLYIEALVDVIKKGIESFTPSFSPRRIRLSAETLPPRGGGKGEGDIHVLFSAHSLPQKFIDEGDPYVQHIKGTIDGIAKRIEIKWHLSYQSKSGPVKWLEPSTDEKLKELAAKGVRNILVVPISFVSDHIETLYEIDILYRQMAEGLGLCLRRTESLNTHPVFIEAMRDIIIKNMKELKWIG